MSHIHIFRDLTLVYRFAPNLDIVTGVDFMLIGFASVEGQSSPFFIDSSQLDFKRVWLQVEDTLNTRCNIYHLWYFVSEF